MTCSKEKVIGRKWKEILRYKKEKIKAQHSHIHDVFSHTSDGANHGPWTLGSSQKDNGG